MAAQANLLAKAQCVTASLENLMKMANANSSLIPDDFRKEVEDLKLAMATIQRAQQKLLATAASVTSPAAASRTPGADVRSMLSNTKKLMESLEKGRIGGELPDHVVDCMATVN